MTKGSYFILPFAMMAVVACTPKHTVDEQMVGSFDSVTQTDATESLYPSTLANDQRQAASLSEYLNAISDPAYVDMYLKHEPKTHTVVLFTDADTKERQAWFEKLRQKFGTDIRLQKAVLTKVKAQREFGQIKVLLNRHQIDLQGGYDIEFERHQVRVDETDYERAKQLLQALPFGSRIDLHTGGLAVPEAGLN